MTEEKHGIEDAESYDLLEKVNCALTQTDNSLAQNLIVKIASSFPGISRKGSDDSINERKSKAIRSRTILWYLTFTGAAINFMLRVNLNIAIVDMIHITNSPHKINKVSDCYNNTVNFNNINANVSSTDSSIKTGKRFSLERMILNYFKIDYNENGFEWNEHEQGMVLGSFYWLCWGSQIPGGILARKYGTKAIFGWTNFIGCLLSIIMPIAAFIDIRILIFLRVIQGFIVGVVWPSLQNITARWIPPNERSTFVTAYSGSSVGIAIFLPLFGYMIAWTSWEWVFHFCAFIGVVWFIAWEYFVYDTPAEHPRIDPNERDYIIKSIGTTIDNHNRAPTPWLDILKSIPVWVNVIALFGATWSLLTLVTQTPTYFKFVHGWDLRATGLLSGLPHFTKMIFGFFASVYLDHLLKTQKMSRTNVRKCAVIVSNTISGFFIVAIAYSGCNSLMAVTFLTLSLTVSGASSAGPMASIVDMSPNFSGIVCGISTMICVIPGFVSPIIVGHLTLGSQTAEQWKYVYLITALLLIVTGILYVLFSYSEVQYWNNTTRNSEKNETDSKWLDIVDTNNENKKMFEK